ncbi:DNA sulfur modification protein DndB [Planktothrix sp. FACHB-1365]|uniref:DNA sulfur modification protein DndB n=1 Tax=Planktothrix sp. FACHB-1365 TaxID=2692855 RepID=UPI0016856D2F|nr:DNA sulfur modification protein DndB [Planktothrix sp. FACHB-1365]MBD2482017.1 DNA sulfur modification protein DndB [Planktothrix sp. FACHB-1365]
MTEEHPQKRSSAEIIMLPTQQDAINQAFTDAATCGARVFQCHVYEQGQRVHLAFCLSFEQLLEMAKFQTADKKKNRANAEDLINRPLVPNHVNEIAKYLLETDNYILPSFIFNCKTPIKVFAFGSGVMQFGYAVLPSNVELYVTDGQHRIKAIEKAVKEKPELLKDSATVLVVQEDDIDQIHQDFADCAKNKPIPQTLLATFDVSDALSKLTRDISKDLVIFAGRIDKISQKLNEKDSEYLFTMNQLRLGIAELLFGSSQKTVIESRKNQNREHLKSLLEQAKYFYLEFAKHNDGWSLMLTPKSQTTNLDFSKLRKERIDFNSVGLQLVSRVGHLILFENNFNEDQRNFLIKTLADLGYKRTTSLWGSNLLMDDGNGNMKIINNATAVNKAFRIAVSEIENQTGLLLK